MWQPIKQVEPKCDSIAFLNKSFKLCRTNWIEHVEQWKITTRTIKKCAIKYFLLMEKNQYIYIEKEWILTIETIQIYHNNSRLENTTYNILKMQIRRGEKSKFNIIYYTNHLKDIIRTFLLLPHTGPLSTYQMREVYFNRTVYHNRLWR